MKIKLVLIKTIRKFDFKMIIYKTICFIILNRRYRDKFDMIKYKQWRNNDFRTMLTSHKSTYFCIVLGIGYLASLKP